MVISFKRIAKSGWDKFFRDRSSSSAALVIMVVVIFLVTSLLVLQGFAAYVLDSVQNRVDVSAYFTNEASEQDILEAKNHLLLLEEVKDVEYVSREEALERFKEFHKNDEVVLQSLDAVGGNPLLAALHIRAWDPSTYDVIVEYVEKGDFAGQLSKVDYQNRAPVIERIVELSSATKTAVGGISVILGIIAVLVAFNTIRLTIYNSREEIEVMRLVGASNWFIRGPFLVEGVLTGFLATVLTLLVVIPALFVLSPKIESIAPGFNLWSYFAGNIFTFLFFQLLVGVGLGILSAFIAIRKYLKV